LLQKDKCMDRQMDNGKHTKGQTGRKGTKVIESQKEICKKSTFNASFA
jgi:hypothetical protein